jgi:hypothetical protein
MNYRPVDKTIIKIIYKDYKHLGNAYVCRKVREVIPYCRFSEKTLWRFLNGC